ncbi:MAG: hypothetical protein DRQ51_00970 [Gammaproteobacteria bacterium]|nr:MAG: hypothetical protein DRQ51_00970 [Gammaproteobacteria bacterium]
MNKIIDNKKLYIFLCAFVIGTFTGCGGGIEEDAEGGDEEITFYEEEGYSCFDKESEEYDSFLDEMELDRDYIDSLPDGEQEIEYDEDDEEAYSPIQDKADLGASICLLESDELEVEIEEEEESEELEVTAESIAESGKYILLSQKFFLSNRLQSSLNAVNRAIKLNPYSALGYQIRGSIFYKARFLSKAKKAWEKAIELDPTLYRVRMHLETIYF